MLHNTCFPALSRSHLPRTTRSAAAALVIIGLIAAPGVTPFADDRAVVHPVLAATAIRGVTVYSAADLYDTYRDQLGQPIDRASAQTIVQALERMYVRDGYSRPLVKLEANLVSSGILRMEVLEPQITRVTVSGEAGPYRERIESLARPLQDMQPVRRDSIQRVLQRVRELPGLSVAADTHRDDTRPNGYELVLDATYEGLEGVVQVTNRGTKEIGPHFLLGQAVANGLFGGGEKLGLVFAAATDYGEFHGGGGFIDVALGEAGTRLALNGFRSLSTPNEEPVNLPDDYVRDRITLRVTHPLHLKWSTSASLTAAFDVDELEIGRAGAILRDERLRIVEAGARVSWRGGDATQYLGTLEVRKGLDGFGSGLRAADLVNDPRRVDFLLTRMQLVRLTRLGEVWSVRFDALAQHSGYVLPYSERFKIGGERLGRGFEVTEIAGDVGAGAKAELRRELPGAPEFLGKTSVYGFYDYGVTWKQDLDDRQSAATVGAGFGIRGGRLAGYLEVAAPLTHVDVEGEETTRVFAEISYRF